MTTTSEVLTVESAGDVATLWLDRPAKRNAMGPAFWSDLPAMMGELGDDPGVRAVVVAGRGAHFSAGIDLAMLASDELAGGGSDARHRSPASVAGSTLRAVRHMQRAFDAVARCPKPVIAAIWGSCIGGGVDLIASCDIRIAAADAVFSLRETKMAIVADLGSLQRLPRIIGQGHLAELAFTGKDVDAARAKEIGLVNGVFADAEAAAAAAHGLAREIAACSPLAVQGTKAILAAADEDAVAQGLRYVAAWNAAFIRSDDLTEAVEARLENRPARFTGR